MFRQTQNLSLDVDRQSADEMSRAAIRYQMGEHRRTVFSDLVLGSISGSESNKPTVLDVGCGRGFDGDPQPQQSIAARAERLIGVEPDVSQAVFPWFSHVYRCPLEEVSLKSGSVNVAYSVFVLEHIVNPAPFWRKIYDLLAPGGVFWGLTVDARHPFWLASSLLASLELKDLYLTQLRGKRGQHRYENYPTFYRANTPRCIRRKAPMFAQANFQTLNRIGQMNFYLPHLLRPFLHGLQRFSLMLNLPGANLLVRLAK